MASAGNVTWLGRDLHRFSSAELRAARREMQIVFQDPVASLDPRMSVLDSVAEPLAIFRAELSRATRSQQALQMLARVGLETSLANRYPHALSGGQCQRAAIARALILQPKLLICDEPVSSLDVSVQSQVLDLLKRLQQELHLGMLFISHNLAVIRQVSQRVLVLYLGRVMEMADSLELYEKPLHPYTEALMSSVPRPDPRMKKDRIIMEGDVADPGNPPPGCLFHPRCRYAQDICKVEVPALRELKPDHFAACHFAETLDLKGVADLTAA